MRELGKYNNKSVDFEMVLVLSDMYHDFLSVEERLLSDDEWNKVTVEQNEFAEQIENIYSVIRKDYGFSWVFG